MAVPQSVTGRVVRWDDDQGWGVLESDDISGTVFAHFSHVQMNRYRTLSPGQSVEFIYEPPRAGRLRPRSGLGQACLTDNQDQPHQPPTQSLHRAGWNVTVPIGQICACMSARPGRSLAVQNGGSAS